MRINPLMWREVRAPEWIDGPVGRLILRATALVGVVVEQEGIEAVLGFGSDFDAHLNGEYRFRVVGDPKTLCTVFDPSRPLYRPVGESLTNVDDRPIMTPVERQMLEMRREFDLMRYQARMQLREEMQQLRARERRLAVDDPPPPLEVDPVLPVDPEPEAPVEKVG